ncbi:transposase InsO family protein [Rarobacter faecitabidus]|uniref:Transposase InsO family protein n=1 Tax=Rarobacter faecitabidus TaxID=13243 RepID=A0A542ZTQ0_RARFA|nr:transposase InsO family protein [Rarobacter faecitabidus]
MESNCVPADVRWAIANWPSDAERGEVGRFCERHGISRSVFYKIRRMAGEVGPVGATEPGSRRPHRSPRRTDPAVIEHALAVRAWLVEQGLDAGPLSVVARMKRQGLTPPSRATLARAFAAAGLSKPEPRKRPRAANRRFVYPAPNCCWQIDAFAWSLADGTSAAIHQVIDDHSRMAVGTLVADGETAKAAVKVVSEAIRRHGVPQRLLSDNGLAFNPTRRGFTGKLVDYLLDLGVKPITGKPNRPTTQGKNERFHQTLQKWLNARPPVKTITALQALVDEFDKYYNNERVHQALGGQTPAEAWAATAPAPPPVAEPRMPPIPPAAVSAQAEYFQDDTEQPSPTRRTRVALHASKGSVDAKVRANGQVKVLSCLFYIATTRAGQNVHAIWDTTTVEFFADTGESLVAYPRPTATGWYFGPRTPKETPIKGAAENLAVGVDGSVRLKVSKGGYVGALANKFYAGYKRVGEDVEVTWTATTVTIKDKDGTTISEFPKPTQKQHWHGPGSTPSTKS